jgi:hypothetical protein
MEGSGRGIIYSTIMELVWRDWRKPRNLSQDSLSPAEILNLECEEYEAGVLTTRRKRVLKRIFPCYCITYTNESIWTLSLTLWSRGSA